MGTDRQDYTIKEFCEAYRMSESFLRSLWAKGEGPERVKVGRKVFITREAATAWASARNNG